MKIVYEQFRIKSEINKIYDILTRHCNISPHHQKYVSRAARMITIISQLLSENCDELEKQQKEMFSRGAAQSNKVLIEFSIALKNAMDILLEDKDGRDYLRFRLQQLESTLRKTILILTPHDTQESMLSNSRNIN